MPTRKPIRKNYQKVTVPPKTSVMDKARALVDKYVPKKTSGQILNEKFKYNPFKRIEPTTWFNASNSPQARKPMSVVEKLKAKNNQATNDGGG